MNNKPYYLLHEALYQSKEHGMKFDFPDDYISELRDLDLITFVKAKKDITHLFEVRFCPSDPSVFEPKEGDESREGFVFKDGGWIDGEHFFDQLEDPKLTAFRNGKPFLNPRYEVKK